MQRITIPEIKKHPWFLKNLPKELIEGEKTNYEDANRDRPTQSVEEIMRVINEARKSGDPSKAGAMSAVETIDTDDEDVESEVDLSGEFVGSI